MTPEFSSYIAPAQPKSQIWRVLCVIIIWILGVLVFSMGLFFMASFLFENLNLDKVLETANFTTPPAMLLMLSTFVIWVWVLVGAVWFLHRRGLKSLLGPDLQMVVLYFAGSVFCFGVLAFLLGLIFPEQEEVVSNLDFGTWLFYLLPGLVLLFVQVSAEELLFRGYLMQQLAVKFNNRLVYMGVPSVIFGLAHYDATYGVATAGMIVIASGLLGLFLADLTYRTGNLGAAIGVHFANNFIAMFWTSYQESASGLALYRVPYYFENPAELGDMLMIYIGVFSVLFVFYWIFMERRVRNRLQSD